MRRFIEVHFGNGDLLALQICRLAGAEGTALPGLSSRIGEACRISAGPGPPSASPSVPMIRPSPETLSSLRTALLKKERSGRQVLSRGRADLTARPKQKEANKFLS